MFLEAPCEFSSSAYRVTQASIDERTRSQAPRPRRRRSDNLSRRTVQRGPASTHARILLQSCSGSVNSDKGEGLVMATESGAGLAGVIAGRTAIATVGKEGKGLTYRGYSIYDLAENSTFEEVAYLLIYGELPKRQ